MMSETVIDKPVDDTDYGYKEMGSEARQKEVDSYVQKELGRCIGCGSKATRTNNTLCSDCWHDAEGSNE